MKKRLFLLFLLILCLSLSVTSRAYEESNGQAVDPFESQNLILDGEGDDSSSLPVTKVEVFSSFAELKGYIDSYTGDYGIQLNYYGADDFVFEESITIPYGMRLFFGPPEDGVSCPSIVVPSGTTVCNEETIVLFSCTVQVFGELINDAMMQGSFRVYGRLTNFGRMFVDQYLELCDGGSYDGDGEIRIHGIVESAVSDYLSGFDLNAFSVGKYYFQGREMGIELKLEDRPLHSHTLIAVAESGPTCTEEGTQAYWQCTDCGRLFSDANGDNELDVPVMIPALGHELIYSPRQEPSFEKEGHIEYWHCSRCDRVFVDETGEKEITMEETALPRLSDQLDFDHDGEVTAADAAVFLAAAEPRAYDAVCALRLSVGLD